MEVIYNVTELSMWYKTKRELLRSVGRHEKDSKWVDRWLARGTIVRRNWLYSMTSDYLKELEEWGVKEVIVEKVVEKVVEKEVEKEVEKSDSPSVDNSNILDHLHLLFDFNMKRKLGIDNAIKTTYNSGNQISWEEATSRVYKAMGLEEDDFAFEEDELAYIIEHFYPDYANK